MIAENQMLGHPGAKRAARARLLSMDRHASSSLVQARRRERKVGVCLTQMHSLPLSQNTPFTNW
jgi:hypothetical protein